MATKDINLCLKKISTNGVKKKHLWQQNICTSGSQTFTPLYPKDMDLWQ
jgi:hypothetical protein